jgi:GDP-D-mannose dehydratase
MNFTYFEAARLLELKQKTRRYHASTSEIYGLFQEVLQ